MSIQVAEKLLADPKAGVESLLEVLTWLNKDIDSLRARKKCAQSQVLIDEIAKEISGNESAVEKVTRRILEKCS
ncbi:MULTISPECIES: hypothetical protein [unclassified Microcoleus]|uniref:hypothetical protein n=1 Tax=unclassified Microcoleus TaxID=2642155 RepID=UPI0025EB68E7|nr:MULTISPECIES: hypothetical protein [unclassified Microcoleus]